MEHPRRSRSAGWSSATAVEAVPGIDFEVRPGETFGFLGPNGAGKSTTINILCTLAEATAGEATVAGLRRARERDEVRRNIGLVFQEPTLDGYLTAEQNLRFHGELYGVTAGRSSAPAEEVLSMVGLWERRGDLVQTFSGGMRRRLEIARGLLHSPRVLFLDEPTIGLDPQTRASIWDYIERAAPRARRSRSSSPPTTWTRPSTATASRSWTRARSSPSTPRRRSRPASARTGCRSPPTTTRPRSPRCADRFGIEAAVHEGAVTFAVPDGARFVPQLFAGSASPIRSVTVTRPSLDDVFLAYTGTTIRDAEAAAPDEPDGRSRRRGGDAR